MNTYLQCNFACSMNLSSNISGNKNSCGYTAGLEYRFGPNMAGIIKDYCKNNSHAKKWTHEEVEEWFKCTDCMTAHGKAIAEETKLKRLFPKEFALNHLKRKAPTADKYIHKL